MFLDYSNKNDKYALVFKDDPSDFISLEPTVSASSEHRAKVLLLWARVFTVADVWVSNQGFHFKNEVHKHLACTHRIDRNRTVPYSPRVNGTVESVMLTVLSATRAMRVELQMAPFEWLSMLLVTIAALNKESLERLVRRDDGLAQSPLEVMMELKPKCQPLNVLPALIDHFKAKTLEHARAVQVTKIQNLQDVLDAMHKGVNFSLHKRRRTSHQQA